VDSQEELEDSQEEQEDSQVELEEQDPQERRVDQVLMKLID
jgi:hypothetical protein